ncbi:MAG TPA: SLC13 family permease [Xanthobacteraceae bacterium]
MQGERSDAEIGQGRAAAESARRAPLSHPLGYARLLGQVDLFAGLERVTLAKLAAHLEPQSYKSRDIIFRQGDPGDAFYLVAGGSAGVYLTDESGATEIRVRVLDAGEPFGEMALLTNRPRTTTIKAETDCEVLRLDRSAFLDLVREQPSAALAIAATLSRRLADMLHQPDDSSATTASTLEQADGGIVAAAAAARPRWRPGRGVLALAAAIGMLGVGWAVPPPLGLSAVGWHALLVLLAALPALALDAMLEGVLALLIAGAWVVLGIAGPAVALAGFATTSWLFVVAVLIIGAAISATGLLYRLALAAVTHMRGGFPGEVTALSLAGLVIGPAVPNGTSRVIMIAPMLKELVEALGYRERSKPAAGLAMAVLIGFGQMVMFLTSSVTAILVLAVLPAEAQKDLNWVTWALYGAPANIILLVGSVASILWLYRPAAGDRQRSSGQAASLALQRALLGPISRDEKIALGVGIGLLLGFTTQPLHHVDPAWIAVLAAGVLAATRVVTVATLRAVNWDFALLFGILISLATVFGRTGLDRWMAERIAAAAGDPSAAPVVFVVVVALLCFAISFVVRWQAAAPLITIALAPVASAAGVHPFVVGLIALLAGNGFFLPYQSTSYLALYSGTGGKLFTHTQALPAALAYGLWTMVALALSVPAWRLMGLL